nr:hypothetical protein CFP56_54799 [Quercus suber]
MEVSDLITRANRLSCEDAKLELPPNQNPNGSPELTLLAKLITSKDISLTYVKDITLKAWKPVYPMEVKKLDKNLFTFSFQHEVDLHKAFSMRPWSCKGGHLILKRWSPDTTWQEIDFTTSTFWVQIHGLPALWRSESNLRRIGAHIGQVLEVNIVGELGGCWKKFLLIRVDIQTEKPLTPGNDDIPTDVFACPVVPSSYTTNTDPPLTHSSVTPSITVPSTQLVATHTTKYFTTPADNTTLVPTHRTWKTHNIPTTPLPPVTQATTNKSWRFELETHIGSVHHPQAGPVEDMTHLNTPEKEQLIGPHSLIQLTPVQVSLKPNYRSTINRPSPHNTNPGHVPDTTLPFPSEDKSELLNPSLSTLSSFSPSSPNATHPHSSFVSDNSLLQTNETTTPPLPNLLKRKSTPNATEPFSKRLKKAVYGPKPIYFDPDSATLIPQSELEHFFRNESQKFKVGEPTNSMAPPYFSKKKKAWEGLTALLEAHQGPWMCMGDFNFILNKDEALGGKKGSSSGSNYLNELMFEFGAIDLGYTGSKYTWAKDKWGNASIKRRLDRGIANISWRLAFPRASISHLGAIRSDHTPILLDTNPQSSFAHRPFRFEVT